MPRMRWCGLLRDMKDESQDPGTSPQPNEAQMSASEEQHKSSEEAIPPGCSFLGVFFRKKRCKVCAVEGGAKQEELAPVVPCEEPPQEVNQIEVDPSFHPVAELQLLHGKYREEFLDHGVLAQGFISTVYLATRKSTGARSAVKEVSLAVALPEKCLREFHILRQLDHPNIVRLLDAWLENDMLYLETELCARSLQSILDEQGDVPRQAWHQIVSALAYLHSKHIVHRDLSPDNIFITESGQVKVGDFDLSKQLGDEAIMASPPHKVGHQLYNSGSAPPNDLKTDVHALGILLLDMLLVKQETRGRLVRSFSRQRIVPELLKEPKNRYYLEKVCTLTSVDRESRPTAAEILEDDSFRPLFDCNFGHALN